MCQRYDVDIPEHIIPQIAYGFAGGIGNTGAVCGAVAGAVMAIGLDRPRPQSMPWLGISYNAGGHDVTLAGNTLKSTSVVVFPAVHLGYRFR